MSRAIRSGGGFRLLIAQYNSPQYRDLLLVRLEKLHKNSRIFLVDRENPPNFGVFQRRISELATKSSVLYVLGLPDWPSVSDSQWLPSLNQRRDGFAADCPIPLVFWLSDHLIKQLALQAPDMWSWRAGVFDFTVQSEAIVPRFMAGKDKSLTAHESERRRKRIDRLKAYAKSHSDLTPSLRASLLRERGDLHNSIGELKEALICFDEALALYKSLNDELNIAETRDRMAYSKAKI